MTRKAKKRAASANEPFRLTGPMLSHIAATMVPFFKKIAVNYTYALKWSKAVRTADLDTLSALFKLAVPGAKLNGFSTNAIGYFFDFDFPDPVLQYSVGTTIPPGTTQFTFSTPIHRAIARAALPFYRALASSSCYAAAVAAAINGNKLTRLRILLRQKITASALKSIRIEFSGAALSFKYSSSKFTYRHLLFREIVG
ncbi:hypothetical protein [Paenibacillus montanisoli]|uniref:Uncharacterized protein n=1 Tax=Paenibacillus montanisoli TaxID=2081970 RepID=A0A328U6L3_9BACL|nr:hypothetical protein [Paenibacillus montanisoli]RAP78209.1 hypothetical protein DL346_07205 [Paenibacillus montanisoli]